MAGVEFDTGSNPPITENQNLMPYGEEINPPAGNSEQLKFTGKPRDKESGLDFFGARYFGNNLMRWMSPDQEFSDVDRKYTQSWNRYSYVEMNPLKYMDNNGRYHLKSFKRGKKYINGKEIIYKYWILEYEAIATRRANSFLESLPIGGPIVFTMDSLDLVLHDDTTAPNLSQYLIQLLMSCVPIQNKYIRLVYNLWLNGSSYRVNTNEGEVKELMAKYLVKRYPGQTREIDSSITHNENWNTLIIYDVEIVKKIHIIKKKIITRMKIGDDTIAIMDYLKQLKELQ